MTKNELVNLFREWIATATMFQEIKRKDEDIFVTDVYPYEIHIVEEYFQHIAEAFQATIAYNAAWSTVINNMGEASCHIDIDGKTIRIFALWNKQKETA